MSNDHQQSDYDAAIQAIEAAEAALAGVNDPELWREVYRSTGNLQAAIDGEPPSPIFDPLGIEPEILPGSPAATAIAFIGQAAKAIESLRDARLRVMALARLQAANILFVSGGDLSMPLW